MIQLHILSGRQADSDIVVRRFPFVIGRGTAHLPMDDGGVWERHLQIDFQRGEGFSFVSNPEASVVINGEPAAAGFLRNGDLVELGSASLRVWLTRAEQRSLGWREMMIWSALLSLFVAQAVLIWWLLS